MRIQTAIFIGIAYCLCGCLDRQPKDWVDAGRLPGVWPDYNDVTIPPNIAPLNFLVKEHGDRYYIQIRSTLGRPVEVCSRSGAIKIPIKQWRQLVQSNIGQDLSIEVYVQASDGRWQRFMPLVIHVASDPVDRYLVYRLIRPLFMYVGRMGLYQRDLTSFAERPILLNTATGGNCINCHAFHNYNPDRMILHMRAGKIGTYMLMAYDGQVFKVDTKTEFNHATSYRCWHPDGRTIAFAFNIVRQVFHARGQTRDVYDRASDLLVYDAIGHRASTSVQISSPRRMETYPEWSPDGRFLYLCSGPALEDVNGMPEPHKAMRYDLMRIPYEPQSRTFGQIEMVLNTSQMGLSAAHPKISPDGRYLLVCISDCTYFPLYRPESDLYLLDLSTGRFSKAENINSAQAEGYHCWSSNGRWVIFSSKREDGECTHLYLCYFDKDGHFHKPFLMPQQDPAYHSMQVVVYNLPEFLKAPIRMSPRALVRAAWSKRILKTTLDPTVASRLRQPVEDVPYTSLGTR